MVIDLHIRPDIDLLGAMGQAITLPTMTHLVNSFESRTVIPETDAPRTLRIPISLVRCSAMKEAKPKRPRQEMNIAKIPFQIGRFTSDSVFGSNDLDLQDIEPYQISRCHCLISIVDNEYYIIDIVKD